MQENLSSYVTVAPFIGGRGWQYCQPVDALTKDRNNDVIGLTSKDATHTTPTGVPVSVVVCTRNRRANILPTAETILANTHRAIELLVMDQSDDLETRQALGPLLADNRLRYVRLGRPGKPFALNEALRLVRNEYVLLTDDDCEPGPDWIEAMTREFERDPRLGAVFGSVEMAPHDKSKGLIAKQEIHESSTIRRLAEFLYMPGLRNFGIGANMAVRKSVIEGIGGWDPCLGPGAKFGCADDHDLTARILMAGYSIRFCAESHVVHFGFREWEQVRKDVERAGFGFGASFAKHLRCGRWYSGAARIVTFFLWRAILRAFAGKRPLGLIHPKGWAKGFIAGMKHPVNRQTRAFRDVDFEESLQYGDQFAQVVLRNVPVTTAKKGSY